MLYPKHGTKQQRNIQIEEVHLRTTRKAQYKRIISALLIITIQADRQWEKSLIPLK
jgi:hypothetical protein